jgi:hypothetical protein
MRGSNLRPLGRQSSHYRTLRELSARSRTLGAVLCLGLQRTNEGSPRGGHSRIACLPAYRWLAVEYRQKRWPLASDKGRYPTTPEWVQAVKREVDEVLLPRPDHLAAKAAEFITTDRILEDIALEERLDAMVDRAMRRLAQMKFMKQLSASSERQLQNAPTLQIEGPRRPRPVKTKK